jgi:nitroimidazol reductase NimA-like FMN-containing flavoprotein (pyridoxamine 5'-phosphate oxidase superfamily)
MSPATEAKMGPEEIDEFIATRETGVLTLARENEPYSIPISYGYNATDRTFYMRLVSTPESEKRAFLSSSPTVRLVIYDGTDDESMYWSVVAKGALEELDPAALSVEDIEQYGDARRPLFEVWGEGRDELDIQLYQFTPEEINGIRTEIERDGH